MVDISRFIIAAVLCVGIVVICSGSAQAARTASVHVNSSVKGVASVPTTSKRRAACAFGPGDLSAKTRSAPAGRNIAGHACCCCK